MTTVFAIGRVDLAIEAGMPPVWQAAPCGSTDPERILIAIHPHLDTRWVCRSFRLAHNAWRERL